MGVKLCAQDKHKITAAIIPESKTINIQQEITFFNQSKDTLNEIYLNDWMEGYSKKNTALTQRFTEEFNKSLHLADKEERGHTKILTVADKNFKFLKWERSKKFDAIRIQLNFPIYPGRSQRIRLSYIVKLPSSRFTGYGYEENGGYNLKYWYLTPVVYDGAWRLENNKDLDDMFLMPSDHQILLKYPEKLYLTTDFERDNEVLIASYKQVALHSKIRLDCHLILRPSEEFTTYKTPSLTVTTNIQAKDLPDLKKGLSIERVGNFITKYLGAYPHSSLVISEKDYRKNPLYGINQLPSFLRPYSEEFQYELKVLKTVLDKFLYNTIYVNPRKEKWITDALQNYLMIKYVETHYPDTKLLGKLSKIWGIRSFHLAQMDFNDQYPFLYMLMARKNLDQPLTTSRDSLIKFNDKIANKYKAGLGLVYLDSYLEGHKIPLAIKDFYRENKLIPASGQQFKNILSRYAHKNIDWFFDEYVHGNKKIDFKITNLVKTEDSVSVTIKNKSNTRVPISLFGINKDSVVSRLWIEAIDREKTITIPRGNTERLVLNFDKIIPEFNQRNNWRTLGGFLSSNKKLKFQFFKDAEDPYYNQMFYVPVMTFNIYDGVTPGMRIYNKTLLERPFVYDLKPMYATKEKTWVGSGRLSYRNYFKNSALYRMDASISGASFHYNPGLRYSTVTPSIAFGFRGEDLRSNERRFLFARYVSVFRDPSTDVETDPDYSVFNIRYNHFNNDIIKYFSWFTDLQIADKFSKVSINAEFRRLFQNNTQLNIRFFAGKFLRNETNSDFFSYALDRPTDYLFDYDYLGRSEDSGIYSQQLIIAEGGFKSKIDYDFANDWILTSNASVNLWRWVELYGDVGFLKNRSEKAHFVYDSGIRLNLVTDYFELYFPLYSNNGWEIAQPNYDQKIRFIVTLSPRTLIGLFTRKWF